LPAEDVDYLDAYAQAQDLPSRSAVLHKAVRLLRASELGAAYEDAWNDWTESGEAEIWDVVTSDGIN
jgi:Arc/MetJ-type ribon-helix-helix transcriptional regulator